MKTKTELLNMLYAKLAEIQYYQSENTDMVNTDTYSMVMTQLELLYDILGDDVPEEYWEQIENAIYYY